MKIFVSSLISGMEVERAAVKQAIEVLGHRAIMAEQFGARPTSPQIACLQGVREADLVVMVLGPRYGVPQQSGLSATHEEFNEAKGRKRILTFVQSGTPEPAQAGLIQQVGGWESGYFYGPFDSAADLGEKVTRAIHQFEMAHAVAPLEPDQLRDRALALLPDTRRDASDAFLALAVSAGPSQAVLRPSDMEAPTLTRDLQRQALFGSPSVFDTALGTQSRFDGEALVISQPMQRGVDPHVALWPSGDILIQLPATQRNRHEISLPVIIEEDVEAALQSAIAYVAWLLDRIDATQKLTHVALAARISGGSFFGWRTLAEHQASPNSGTVAHFGVDEQRIRPAMLTPPHRARQALVMNAQELVQDLVVLLRRQWMHR